MSENSGSTHHLLINCSTLWFCSLWTPESTKPLLCGPGRCTTLPTAPEFYRDSTVKLQAFLPHCLSETLKAIIDGSLRSERFDPTFLFNLDTTMEGVVLVGKWFEHILGISRVCRKMGLHTSLITFKVFQNIGVFHWYCCDVSGGPYTTIYQSLIFQSSWYLGLWEQFAIKRCLT